MDQTMIERVATAMKKRASEPVANLPHVENALVGSLGDVWPYLARAALEAIREPTDEMIRGARESGAFENDVFRVADSQIGYAISCAISAALESTGRPT